MVFMVIWKAGKTSIVESNTKVNAKYDCNVLSKSMISEIYRLVKQNEMPRIIKKMIDFWKIVLDSSQSWNCVDYGFWVYLVLVTWLMPWIIGKMTDFWRLVFSSIISLLATRCDTLITVRENHWLLRVIWSFSESMTEYESVFRMCV